MHGSSKRTHEHMHVIVYVCVCQWLCFASEDQLNSYMEINAGAKETGKCSNKQNSKLKLICSKMS